MVKQFMEQSRIYRRGTLRSLPRKGGGNRPSSWRGQRLTSRTITATIESGIPA